MSVKKFILSCLTVAAAFSVSAQQKTENVYVPNWYVQGQLGGQHTIGEIAFTDLNSFNAQLGVGYNFNEFLGTRLTVNGWKSKAGWETTNKLTGNTLYETWSWNYVSPVVDVTANLANMLLGYNPNRLVNFGVFAGLGANIAFGNDDAAAANNVIMAEYNFTKRDKALRYLWDGSKCFFTGRVGANVDFRISDNWAAGLEVQANALSDKYNSKRASTADWYINALVGVKYTFGTSNKKQVVAAVAPENVVQDKAASDEVDNLKKKIEDLENKNAEYKAAAEEAAKEAKVAKEAVEAIRRDVFFNVSCNKISSAEMVKVKEVADFLKNNPNATVDVTGYADKGTGNPTLNAKYALMRATAVKEALVAEGIAESRITTSSKGDTVQPYDEPALNRVAICIVK